MQNVLLAQPEGFYRLNCIGMAGVEVTGTVERFPLRFGAVAAKDNMVVEAFRKIGIAMTNMLYLLEEREIIRIFFAVQQLEAGRVRTLDRCRSSPSLPRA